MKTRPVVAALIGGLLFLFGLSSHTAAGPKGKGFSQSLSSGSGPQEYTLDFIQTQNAPPGAQGIMTLKTGESATVVHFRVRGAWPNTVYTIWIVYNVLADPSVPNTSMDATDRPGFPKEGSPVAPLARLDDSFTSGMGLDPGLVFVTNDSGDGEAQVKLDYNLISHAPVANGDIIFQCVPGSLPTTPPCPNGTKKIRVTTTWLRKYIGHIIHEGGNPAIECANYDPSSLNTLYWQCIDPATVDPNTGNGLPRVYRFEFDHFRLANHLDDLTHGFIGGDKVDHQIDMVGPRCNLMPSVCP